MGHNRGNSFSLTCYYTLRRLGGMRHFAVLLPLVLLFTGMQSVHARPQAEPSISSIQVPTPETLWEAARKGNLPDVERAIDSGVAVDAKTAYGATALSFAADRGHLEVVRYLLSKQANPNNKDAFYNATPMSWASMGNRYEIMKALVLAGADDVNVALSQAVKQGDLELVQQIADKGKASRQALTASLKVAKAKTEEAEEQDTEHEMAGLLQAALDRFYPDAEEEAAAPTDSNRSDSSSANAEIANDKFPASSPESLAADRQLSSDNWPQFRGNGARGIAEGQQPPTQWNHETNQNLAWKTPISGLGHSCPVVWGDRLFVTSAISGQEADLRIGLYGDVTSVEDNSEHQFVTLCLSALTGEVLWQQTACKKVPSVKRHLKSTHANSTVAANDQFVVAWFGSEGLYCYSHAGELIWQRDLGRLDSGWFYDRDYQWQFGASPVIHDGRLILQCDIQDQSFLAMLDIATGEELWRTDRQEIPSWSTPTVVSTPHGLQIVTNATGAARSYAFETGQELWSIIGHSEIVVPTPFSAQGLIFVSSGYRPIQPIYAIRLDALGDLSLSEGASQSEYVAWSEGKGGPYMPSPIAYGDYLYVCANSGILTCYQAKTGELVYKKRLPMKGNRSFVGSPVAADGHLYLTSEEGETAVIAAGPTFELIANNTCGENCLTTPAISRGTFYLRGQRHVFAFRESGQAVVED